MRTMLWVALALLGACGGDPVLRNVPQPNTAKMAGAAAAIAGAATLADPQGAARRNAEANKPDDDLKPQANGGSVPPDVFDRLDDKQRKPEPEPEPKLQPPGGEP
jgi:hypothetical protein